MLSRKLSVDKYFPILQAFKEDLDSQEERDYDNLRLGEQTSYRGPLTFNPEVTNIREPQFTILSTCQIGSVFRPFFYSGQCI